MLGLHVSLIGPIACMQFPRYAQVCVRVFIWMSMCPKGCPYTVTALCACVCVCSQGPISCCSLSINTLLWFSKHLGWKEPMSCSAIPCNLPCLFSGKQECKLRKLVTCTHTVAFLNLSLSPNHIPKWIFPLLSTYSAGASSFTPPLLPLPSPPSSSISPPKSAVSFFLLPWLSSPAHTSLSLLPQLLHLTPFSSDSKHWQHLCGALD